MYTSEIRNDYTLSDAFHALGLRLYGPEWTGREIIGRRVEDPGPILEARAPLEAQLAEVNQRIQAKKKEHREAVGKQAIFQAFSEIKELENEQGELFRQLNEIGEVRDSQREDHGNWERFEWAEGVLLRALADGELEVYCPMGLTVPQRLWAEFPAGFGYDLERSLIFWPPDQSAVRMEAGRIKQGQFETWLDLVPPEVAHEVEKLSPEQQARIWFKEQVQQWDGRTKRDEFKGIAMKDFPGLTGNGFKRIWDALATPEMKGPGPRKR